MRRLLAAVALVTLIVACSDSSTSPPKTPVGSWSLASIDGNAPPLVAGYSADTTYYLNGSTLSLGQDGRFSEVYAFHGSASAWDSTFTEADTGTWQMKGTTVTFNVLRDNPAEAYSYTGAFQDSTIVESGSNVWVYRRK